MKYYRSEREHAEELNVLVQGRISTLRTRIEAGGSVSAIALVPAQPRLECAVPQMPACLVLELSLLQEAESLRRTLDRLTAYGEFINR